MARGTYNETIATRTLRALIGFAEGKDGDEELRRSLIAWLRSGDAVATRAITQVVNKTYPFSLDSLRDELRSFVRHLAGAPDEWWSTARPITITIRPLVVEPAQVRGLGQKARTRGVPSKAQRYVSLYVDGTSAHALRDVLLYQILTLVVRVGGLDRLRLCPAPDCGRAYLKIGRREYCSPACQRRAFLQTYEPAAARPRRQVVKKGRRRQ